MDKLFLLYLLLLLSFSAGFSQNEGDLTVIIVGVVLFILMIVIGVVVVLVLRGKGKKKKGISRKSANFARLVKYLCRDSGIPIDLQLQATKMIARDYIDTPGKDLTQLFFLGTEQARFYLKRAGLNDLDADIFFSILISNKNEFTTL
ncbi:Uncharacterised protein [Candidatus Tiddalikarchaeum anstoanum]|nr:Uncharacterised protein [Candidatus Tiddalikarchaeum anstoanum]